MSPANKRKPLIPYLRQSRKNEKTVSIEEQRRLIRSWAEREGVALAPEIVERNVSGSKPWRERGIGEAITTCEAGKASGLIVAFQDRLSREHGLATAEIWDALDRSGARLVCVGEGLDTARGDEELQFGMKALIARDQWKRYRANWEHTRRNAVERGVYGRPPAGYGKDAEGRLVPDEYADAVRAAFEARARGESWQQVASVLTSRGVPTSRERVNARKEGREPRPSRWSIKAVQTLLRNPVYIGVVRSGDYVKENAHKPLVSRALFRKVSQKAAPPRTRGGDGSLLSGLLRCSGCGYRLTPDTNVRPSGATYRFYRCKNHGRCERQVTIGAPVVEPYVINLVTEGLQRDHEAEKPKPIEVADHDARLAAAEAEAAEVRRMIEAREVTPSAGAVSLSAAEQALAAIEDEALAQQGSGLHEAYVSLTREEARALLSGVELPPPPKDRLVHLTGVLPMPERRRMIRELLDSNGSAIYVRPGRQPVHERVVVEKAA